MRTMYSQLITGLCDRLIRLGSVKRSEIIGCTPEQIAEIRMIAGTRLPESYTAFLSIMGCGAGRFFEGIDIHYPDILRVRTIAEELLEEDDSPFRLGSSDFVFSAYLGCQFMFFKLAESDDPSLYRYLELSGQPTKIANSFSEFLTRCVDEEENPALRPICNSQSGPPRNSGA